MMDARTLARLRYPFPALANPHAAALQNTPTKNGSTASGKNSCQRM